MTQYDETVDRQRRLILAEEWAKGVKTLHAHALNITAGMMTEVTMVR